jgi:hypothetical protein
MAPKVEAAEGKPRTMLLEAMIAILYQPDRVRTF